MKPIFRDAGTPRARPVRAGRRLTLCLIALTLAWSGAPLAAQAVPGSWSGQPMFGMWAAQTGPDQVSLAWDSIPGTTGYQVWVGTPDLSGSRPPALSLGARARQSVLFGVDRLAAGIWLVARGAGGSLLQQAQFNPVVREWGVQVMAPAQVTASATSATEVSLTWSQVAGATGYFILRSISPGGMATLCSLCSTTPTYVDHSAIPGAVHSYAVSAIFPNGMSKRTTSNPVTPGVTPAPTTATAPTTTSMSVTSSYDSLTGWTTTVTTTTVCTTVAPISCSSTYRTAVSGSGRPTANTTGSTPATSPAPAPTPPTSTPSTPSTSTGTPAPGAPQTVGGAVTGAIGAVTGALNTALGTLAGPANVTATVTGPGAVRLSWQASPTTGVRSYLVSRRINGGSLTFVDSVAASVLAYSDVMFPTTLFGGGPVRVSYEVAAATTNVTSRGTATSDVIVQSPRPASAGATAACKLDYQRADNMWAAFGRPDGFLGTETISLAQAQDKVFVTDWKYEKQRNDGSNFYGSHLRIATNSSTRTVRLQLRTLTLTGLFVWVRTGADTFWIRLGPGQKLPLQADLMEVYCE